MKVSEFVDQFILPNTLIRLWYKAPKDQGIHEEAIQSDKPMMEHELIKSEFKNHDVIGITDIMYLNSHYKEAVNLVIKRK